MRNGVGAGTAYEKPAMVTESITVSEEESSETEEECSVSQFLTRIAGGLENGFCNEEVPKRCCMEIDGSDADSTCIGDLGIQTKDISLSVQKGEKLSDLHVSNYLDECKNRMFADPCAKTQIVSSLRRAVLLAFKGK